ncbi:MAG: FliM/FliN family flagellar motor switch protein [Bryobacteraceae bacterium]
MTPQEEIAYIADVPLELEMELDRKIMPVQEILEWGPDSVIWLTRSAGENIDVYAGGALLGFGEIVIIENAFGVRITDFNAEA